MEGVRVLAEDVNMALQQSYQPLLLSKGHFEGLRKTFSQTSSLYLTLLLSPLLLYLLLLLILYLLAAAVQRNG
ncbi:unnamed protein product [Taenia asiatica]|uniref:Transmembrane protein n=1 Tax=Taenia asiatica TaxID=60517 RepID=A0A0R3W2T0_TAEAS|nr:unnamed protein product [Taenia asiatica]